MRSGEPLMRGFSAAGAAAFELRLEAHIGQRRGENAAADRKDFARQLNRLVEISGHVGQGR